MVALDLDVVQDRDGTVDTLTCRTEPFDLVGQDWLGRIHQFAG